MVHRSRYTYALPTSAYKPLSRLFRLQGSCSVRQTSSLCSLAVTFDTRLACRRNQSDKLDRHAAQPSRIHNSNIRQVSLKQNIAKM